MPASTAVDFEVRRDDWQQCRVVEAAPAALADGQVLWRVDRFALTANNVTYALTGDLLGYWSFFPAAPGWGRLPVMGFGDVLRSRHPEVAEGTRAFGFYPMSTHLLIDAGEVRRGQILDVVAHRRGTALAYRQYVPTDADPLYDPAREDALLLLRGLFLTSFLVDDFLADQGGFGARQFVVSSASSKTAIALAHQLRRRAAGAVIGLTSARHRAFVAGLGCYDEVLPYGELGGLAADVPTAFVDHSGDAAVVRDVHQHWRERLVYSGIVGATHWDRGGRQADLPGAAPAFFFAPAQLEKRQAEWGPAGFQARLGDAWRAFLAFSDGWLEVVRGRGPAAVERVYRAVLEGRAEPRQGHILSLHA